MGEYTSVPVEPVESNTITDPIDSISTTVSESRKLLLESVNSLGMLSQSIKLANGEPIESKNPCCLLDNVMEVKRLAELNLQVVRHIRELLGL